MHTIQWIGLIMVVGGLVGWARHGIKKPPAPANAGGHKGKAISHPLPDLT